MGGILSASKMHLSMLNDSAAQNVDLMNVSSMLDHASREIRTIAHNLFPDILLMNELDVAIGNFCERIKSPGLNVEFCFLGIVPRLNNSFKLAIYRAVQELVNNVIKHSRADHVLVQVSHHEDLLTVVVEDNGVGFDKSKPGGMGLVSLEQKMKNMDGTLSIESEVGKGTSVQLEFDLSSFKESHVMEASTVGS